MSLPFFFFSSNFKGAEIREQTQDQKETFFVLFFFCLSSPMLGFSLFTNRTVALHETFNLHLCSLQITHMIATFFPKQAQVELELLSVSVLSSSSMPRAKEETGEDSWVLMC